MTTRTINPLDVPQYPQSGISEYLRILRRLAAKWKRAANARIKTLLATVTALFVIDQDLVPDDSQNALLQAAAAAALALLRQAMNELRAEWMVAITEIIEPMARLFDRVNSRQRSWWFRAVSRVTGVPVEALLQSIREPWLAGEQQSRLDANTSILEGVATTALLAIERALRSGIRSSSNRQTVLREVGQVFERIDRQMIFTARNQVEEHAAALNEQRQRQAGTDRYVWLRTVSRNPRLEHLRRVGQIFRWDRPPPDGHPGHASNCKCGAAPYWPETIYGLQVRV